jgi:hypothetical protein
LFDHNDMTIICLKVANADMLKIYIKQ